MASQHMRPAPHQSGRQDLPQSICQSRMAAHAPTGCPLRPTQFLTQGKFFKPNTLILNNLNKRPDLDAPRRTQNPLPPFSGPRLHAIRAP